MSWRFLLLYTLILFALTSPLQAQDSPGVDTSLAWGGLRVTPDQLVFAPSALGDSSVALLTVHNDSLRTTTVSQILGEGQSFHVDHQMPLRIPGGASVGLQVVFTPHRLGRSNSTLTIVSDAGEARVSLRGRSPFPVVVADRESIDFGLVARGTLSGQVVTIRNTSINLLTIDTARTHTPSFHLSISHADVPGVDSMVLSVVFSPVFSGAFSDTLVIESNARDHTMEIPLYGVSPPPILEVSPAELQFPHTSIADSAVGQIRIVDASISSLNLQTVRTTGPGFSVRGRSVPSGIPGNDTVVVPVVFRPPDFGEYVDTVVIESDGGSAKIPLRGKSPYPILIAGSDTVAFGDVRKGATARRSIVLRNKSINVLRLDSIYTRTRWFTARARKNTVRSADSLLLEATFVPDRFRSYSDTIVIVGNALNRRVEIPLSGSSPVPVPAVALRSLELEPISLGDTCTGEFVVYNRSSVNDLTIGGVQKKSPFFSMVSRLPVVLGRRDSTRLRIRFTANENATNIFGTHNDTLQVDSDGGPMRVAVTGALPYPSVASGTDELDFGSVQKGARATVPLWLSNPSLNTVRIDSISVYHRRAFSIGGMELPGVIRRGRAHSLTVAFAPDSENVYVDTLQVFSNSPDSPLKVVLSGRCFAPHVAEGTGVGIPTEFCLFKNYPNPFNGTTTIKFGLPRPSNVSLAVYNTLGQLVTELANGYLDAGYHTVTFSSAGLSSGLYFYRFQAGDFVDTKKLVVLR